MFLLPLAPFLTPMKASLIVSIYKNVEALDTILSSLKRQTEQAFELILSEDGNDESMRRFIDSYDFPWPTRHLTQADKGWRKNKSLNRAIMASQTDWLIFIDGDCVLHSRFIEMHLKHRKEGIILAGKRIKLNPELSKRLMNGEHFGLFTYLWWHRGCRYVEEAFFLPFSEWLRRPVRHLVGSNMSISKEALLSINGFDENYIRPATGEDYDIERRLLAKGYRIVSLRNLAIQYHLHHKENWQEQRLNMIYFKQKESLNEIVCKNGIIKL